MEMRTATFPVIVEDERGLREIAANSAHYANDAITERYLRAKGAWNERVRIEQREKINDKIVVKLTVGKIQSYRDYAKLLSGNARDAITTEIDGVWGRLAKPVLAGHRSLPIFNSDRSLCVRDRGIKVQSCGDDKFQIAFQFLPKGNDWTILPVSKLPVKKDKGHRKVIDAIIACRTEGMKDILAKFASGEIALKKGSLVYRRGRWLARLTYTKLIIERPKGEEVIARIGMVGPDGVGPDGELYISIANDGLSFEDHRRLASMSELIQLMQNKKRDIGGIIQRLRVSKKRNALAKVKNFEEWSATPCHQLSRFIVNFCAEKGATKLEWSIVEDGEFPWSKVRMNVVYKARELGMSLEVVEEKRLIDSSTKREERWRRQFSKNLRQMAQATRKM